MHAVHMSCCCSGRKREAQRGRWSERSEDGRAHIKVGMWLVKETWIVMVVTAPTLMYERHYVKAAV